MENKTKSKIAEPEMSFWQFCVKVRAIYNPFRGTIFLTFAMMLLIESIYLINPYIYGKIVDGIVSGKPMISVVVLLLISLGISQLDSLLGYLRERVEIKKIDFKINRHVAEKTLIKLLDFSIGQHENQNSGIKKSIIDRGQHSLESLAYTIIYEIAPVILRVSVVVVALLILAPILGAMVFAGFAILIGLTFYLNVVFRDGLKKIQDNWHEASKKHSEILRNITLVKTNAKELEIIKEFDAILAEAGDFAEKYWIKFVSWALSRSALLHLFRFSVMVVGVYFVYKKIYTAGFLITIWSWSSSAFGDFGRISGMHRRLMELYAAIRKYFILLEVESDIKESKNPLKPKNFSGRIEFKNVYFKYPEREYIVDDKEDKEKRGLQKETAEKENYVLKNINFTIEPGQRVAIVGPSGVGKTSLAHLLIRAYDPEKGKILIDANDLKNLNLESFRSAVGIVPQDVSLFDNTLRYNIAFGLHDKEISEERLWQAAKMACVDKFIAGLEKGFDTIIGERGIKLSGGERQRVGIARALIKNPSFLIFDEATSSLDTENEALIRASIEKASKGRTTIIIAHRLSTIKDADKIIVMEKGKIVGEDKHEKLLKTCKTYQRLINNQTVMVGNM
ncbi:ABC transporter ATP-binding protein [Candidatus Wolfebacteria bacterium]|nr:ABC transporter ATP-binding protein [Candidatus Wolfebacteria bacterium]